MVDVPHDFIIGGDGEEPDSPDYPYSSGADSHHGYIPRDKAGKTLLLPCVSAAFVAKTLPFLVVVRVVPKALHPPCGLGSGWWGRGSDLAALRGDLSGRGHLSERQVPRAAYLRLSGLRSATPLRTQPGASFRRTLQISTSAHTKMLTCCFCRATARRERTSWPSEWMPRSAVATGTKAAGYRCGAREATSFCPITSACGLLVFSFFSVFSFFDSLTVAGGGGCAQRRVDLFHTVGNARFVSDGLFAQTEAGSVSAEQAIVVPTAEVKVRSPPESCNSLRLLRFLMTAGLFQVVSSSGTQSLAVE